MHIVSKPQQNWPPKSPHEALLSSPSGRRKYERRQERNSVSPSPIKRRPLSRAQLDYDEEDEEEDEETLELKLAQIEAQLKLKKLQRARQAKEQAPENGVESNRASSRPATAAGLRRMEFPRPQSALQVPVSPKRNHMEPEEQRSPMRVQLGIDKGLRAQDVSLKRAPNSHSRSKSAGAFGAEAPRIKSFSDRIAESRNQEKEKEERQARIERSRSRGFGLKDVEALREGASSRASSSLSSGSRFPQTAPSQERKSNLAQSRSIGDLRNTAISRPPSGLSSRSDFSRVPPAASSRTSRAPPLSNTATKYVEISQRDNNTDVASFDSFSGLHLKTRNMEHNTITRALEGKTTLTIPQLLKVVKAPDYDPPDMENDYVIFGVIASKSSPLTPKNARREQSKSNQEADVNQSGKFMVMRLTDLKWELDLFLFDTGFSQFWKLPIGTLVAVLNPDIMPPKTRDTGKFSLKLASSDDTVLEMGTVRDLDFCHAQRKDGKECGQWIDGRKTEFCDFHIELQVERSKRGRMEVNTMTGFGKGPGGGGGRHGMFGGGAGNGRGGGSKAGELRREGKYHDKHIHETMYITPGAGAAARLLDEADSGFERGASGAEMLRKRLADKEKERELAHKLGQVGTGAGGDYMRSKGAGTSKLPARGDSFLQPEASSQEDSTPIDPLGLRGKKADDVSLAPIKRKRINTGKSTHSAEPVGWGGAYKKGLLLSPRKTSDASSRATRDSSPVKKKARLLLDGKGIREPGRESLGTMDVGLLAALDDDDDLEII
jgi:minichromosome maintenance protein 10